MRLLLSLALCLAGTACGEDAGTAADPCAACDGGACRVDFNGDPKDVDARSRCIVTEGCASDDDCPNGSGCSTAMADPRRDADCVAGSGGGSGFRCAPCATGAVRRCVVASAVPLEATALLTGFNAAPFDLSPTPGGDGRTFIPAAPVGTLVLECAVFLCNPSFGASGGAMTNVDRCVLSRQLFDTSGLFDLSGHYPPDACQATGGGAGGACAGATCPGAVASLRRDPSMLAAGCWAFDDVHVIGATLLQTIGPAAALAAGLATDCAQTKDDAAPCFADADAGVFGACGDGGAEAPCRPRCVDERDCPALGAVCHHRGEFLGVCEGH